MTMRCGNKLRERLAVRHGSEHGRYTGIPHHGEPSDTQTPRPSRTRSQLGSGRAARQHSLSARPGPTRPGRSRAGPTPCQPRATDSRRRPSDADRAARTEPHGGKVDRTKITTKQKFWTGPILGKLLRAVTPPRMSGVIRYYLLLRWLLPHLPLLALHLLPPLPALARQDNFPGAGVVAGGVAGHDDDLMMMMTPRRRRVLGPRGTADR